MSLDFDIHEAVEFDGISPEKLAGMAEKAMVGLIGVKSKEGNYMLDMLEVIRDDCEGYDPNE